MAAKSNMATILIKNRHLRLFTKQLLAWHYTLLEATKWRVIFFYWFEYGGKIQARKVKTYCILRKICADQSNNMNTLSDYRVPWHHVNTIDNRQVISPTTELDRYILKQMCILYSGGVQEQCASEYWSDGREARVTEIYKLSLAQKNNLRLKKLNCERYLVKLVRDIGISVFCDNMIPTNLQCLSYTTFHTISYSLAF